MYNQIKKDFKIKDLKNNKIYKLNKKRYILKRNILRSLNLKKKSFTQTQTANTFEQVWKYIGPLENDKKLRKFNLRFLKQYFPNHHKIANSIKNGSKLLDVACGNSRMINNFFGKKLSKLKLYGADITNNAVTQSYSFFKGKKIDGNFLQEDINDLPFKKNFFDVIFSPTSLMHTDSVEKSILDLSKLLKKNGMFICWLYNKQPPIRNFTDKLVKNYLMKFSSPKAFNKLYPLTKFGLELGKIKKKISISEDIKFLGIPKGSYSVQYFFYYYILKAFFNKNIKKISRVNAHNFDWHAPANAHCHSRKEIKLFFKRAGLKAKIVTETPSALAIIAKK